MVNLNDKQEGKCILSHFFARGPTRPGVLPILAIGYVLW
jgi:hypothetical protein